MKLNWLSLAQFQQFVEFKDYNRPSKKRIRPQCPQAASSTFVITFSTMTPPNIMNTSSASPQTPNLELLRKAIQEYQPNPSRVPFSNLKPFHDSIVALRGKKASYAVIADLLQQNGVKTSRARVAEYGRIVLDGGKKHKRRRQRRIILPPTPPIMPPAAPKPETSRAMDEPAFTSESSAWAAYCPRQTAGWHHCR